MATDRQIAANRRNARKSTGPRSRDGKKRASRNAYQHGLCLSINSIATMAMQVEQLARTIARDSGDEAVLEHARPVAEAELDLARIRQAKVALIERFVSQPQEIIDPSAAMPTQEPERSAEAVRRALPELLKLDRYERRAALRRDRAVRNLVNRKRANYDGA